MGNNFDIQTVNYVAADGYVVSRALIDISTGEGYDRNMPSKSVRLKANDACEWYEPSEAPVSVTTNTKTAKEEPKKSVAVIEVKEPEKALNALMEVIIQSALNKGLGVFIDNEEELLKSRSLDEFEEKVREIYIAIKEQM